MKEYPCENCGKIFGQKSHWLKHTKNKKYPCNKKEENICIGANDGAVIGADYKIINDNDEKKKVCCRFCLKEFLYVKNLNKHIREERCKILKLQKQQKEENIFVNLLNEEKVVFETKKELGELSKDKPKTDIGKQIKSLNDKLEEQNKDYEKYKIETKEIINGLRKQNEEFKSKLLNFAFEKMPSKSEINKINRTIKKLECTIPINSSQIINNQLINTIIEKDKKIEKLTNDKFNDDLDLDLDLELINDEQNDVNNIEKNKPMNLILNNQIIQYRESDNYVNATQLCKAGGKKFSHWINLDNTKELIKVLETNAGIPALDLIDKNIGGNHIGTWMHPDLAIQLAQWISPQFAIQVSKWIRQLFTQGKVEINLKVLKQKENLIKEHELRIKSLENLHLKRHKRTNYPDSNVVYLITIKELKEQRKYIIGKAIDLKQRLSSYNKISEPIVIYYKSFKTEKQMDVAENMVLEKLNQYKEQANLDRFVLPFDESIQLFIKPVNESYDYFN